MTLIDGKSAALTNQLDPRATTFGADQVCDCSVEKYNMLPFPCWPGSSQVMKTRPSGPAIRLGSALPEPAGDLTSTTPGATGMADTVSIARNATRTAEAKRCLTMAKEFIR